LYEQKILPRRHPRNCSSNLINDASDHGLHGYAIYKAVYKKFGVLLGPSTLYPELKLLEKEELILSSWELDVGRAHKLYRITQKGRSLLREHSAELKIVIPALIA